MNPTLKSISLAVAGGVLTTVLASSLLGINTHLRNMHTDIRVTQVLLLEHKEQHVVIEQQVRNNTDRIAVIEKDVAIITSVQKYFQTVAKGEPDGRN